MKKAGYLSIATLGFFVVTIGAKADPSDSPYLRTDGDGVPLAMPDLKVPPPTQAEINEMQKEEKKTEMDKDWVMRNYELQLKARAASGSPQDPSTNLYYQLGSNKELAKLAGLPDIDSEDGTKQTGPVLPQSLPGLTAASHDSPAGRIHPFWQTYSELKPLITPLSEPNGSGQHDFYSFLSDVPVSPTSGDTSPTDPVSKSDQPLNPTDIETPGMIAADKNPLADPLANNDAPDLTLDVLPGQTIEQARADRDSNNELELPLPMTATELHKEQFAALSVPAAPTVTLTHASAPPPQRPVPTEDPNAPVPVSQQLMINPIRAPIADPYDILNH